LSRSPEVLEIEAPAIVIVEAKKADLRTGFGQCIAEMEICGIESAMRWIDVKNFETLTLRNLALGKNYVGR
jgi:hypothetical protein